MNLQSQTNLAFITGSGGKIQKNPLSKTKCVMIVWDLGKLAAVEIFLIKTSLEAQYRFAIPYKGMKSPFHSGDLAS